MPRKSAVLSPEKRNGTAPKNASRASAKKTRITARIDVGYPNTLYIRGEGAHLNWEKGVAMKNIRANLWEWETGRRFSKCNFKFVVNDEEFEVGENHELKHGETLTFRPVFKSHERDA